MKTLKTLFLALLLAVAVVPTLEAQSVTTRTTLTTASAQTSGRERLVVGSTTGFTVGQFLLIDAEVMRIVAVPSATTVDVTHAYDGVATLHAAGVDVRAGAGGQWSNVTGNAYGAFLPMGDGARPAGVCTRAANQFLPVFQVHEDGRVTAYDCPLSTSSTQGQWINWEYFPGTSDKAARTVPACQAGSTTACTSYTALVSDYYIGITTEFTPDNATFTVTLPCSSVPAGKVWVVGYEGLGAGTTGNGVSIIGAVNTQQILTGITSRGYISNGTNCSRLF